MDSKPHLIDVAIPLPLDGPFTYRVSEELFPRAEVGRRVLVPFKNKIRAGFILGESNGEISEDRVRDVVDIPDEPAYVTKNLLTFLRWIADYYILPFGLVLKTALPPGSDRRSQPWAILTPEGRTVLESAGSETKSGLPGKFLKSGVILLKELKNGIGERRLSEALENGWIRTEERIARPRISLWKKKLPGLLSPVGALPSEAPPTLTHDQANTFAAVDDALNEGGFNPFLLYGVTGSGKTEIYLRAIDSVIKKGKRALILVPEIALTPQLARRFLSRLGGGIALFHSGLTPAQRLDEWRRIRIGAVNVVIAARSGIFVPLDDLALIVVDEEHDPSYKQEDSCPYNARDMALTRGKMEKACVILGSATPSFESFVNAQRGKITRLDLPSRHHGGSLPDVEIVDLRKSTGSERRGALLTPTLLQAVEQTLDRGEQAVVFLNRRGFDTFAQCNACGTVFKCPNCDISLTHHKKSGDLRCHVCGFSRMAPPLCPECSSERVFLGGVGTQKVEEELAAAFPQAVIERLDRDSTRRREQLESILDRFRNKEIDILAGTQMIVKGHDFPGISLVGILCGDQSLHFPDFRASERTFQMLTQVAGRTGRESDSGKVILQTYDPDHEAVRFAASHAYEDFFENDSVVRRELLYPPFGYLILVRVEGNNEKRVESKAIRIGRSARMIKGDSADVMILGPAPCPRKKVVGRFRWQILFKSATRNPARSIVKTLIQEGHLKGQGFKIVVDVDPIDLL